MSRAVGALLSMGWAAFTSGEFSPLVPSHDSAAGCCAITNKTSD